MLYLYNNTEKQRGNINERKNHIPVETRKHLVPLQISHLHGGGRHRHRRHLRHPACDKDESDYYAIYAGPEIFAYQDVKYIERALASVGEDRTGDKQVTVTLKDIVMLSPEELEEAKSQGAKFNNEFLQTSMTEFNQQIFTGDSVICLLSPYMYENVHEEGGFLPLSEIFDEIPDSAYDDCGIILSETDFGKDFQGIAPSRQHHPLHEKNLDNERLRKQEEKRKAAAGLPHPLQKHCELHLRGGAGLKHKNPRGNIINPLDKRSKI